MIMKKFLFFLLVSILFEFSHEVCVKSSQVNHGINTELNMRMNKVHTSKPDQYRCTGFSVPDVDDVTFIKQFIPHARERRAHHMMLLGCSDVTVPSTTWDCGMGISVCPKGKEKILYAWARNAAELDLPKNVGIEIGQRANVRTLVLQIHYHDAMKPEVKDCSGLSVKITRKRQTKFAGVYLLAATKISIPPHQSATSQPVSCLNSYKSKLNVFAFRTHAHDLGRVITAYRVRNNKYTMIGKGNPLWPEAFYKRVGGDVILQPGDKLLMRCDYRSNRDTWTYVGATGSDEMCNFYMMFYTSDRTLVENNMLSCWGNSLPNLKFPASASTMTPYPGYAGISSTMAILSGRAKQPKVPTMMKMKTDDEKSFKRRFVEDSFDEREEDDEFSPIRFFEGKILNE